jgi:hypothetical protein
MAVESTENTDIISEYSVGIRGHSRLHPGGYSHSIGNKLFLYFIFNRLFSC